MNSKNNNSKKAVSKKSSSSKKEITVDPIFIKGYSRCGGCTNSLNNCVCYENISDDAIEQINEYESKYKQEVYQHNETKEQLAFFKKISNRKEDDLAFKQSEKRLEAEREENKRLKKELALLKKDNEKADDNIQKYKNKIKDLENELDEKKDNFNYAAYKDERDYEKDYFDLVNKYNVLETDYLLLKNKTIDYDYILEENSEMKEELDAWKQKYNEKSKETNEIKDALLSNSLKYKWQEVDIKKLEMKIEQQKQTLLKINIMSSL